MDEQELYLEDELDQAAEFEYRSPEDLLADVGMSYRDFI